MSQQIVAFNKCKDWISFHNDYFRIRVRMNVITGQLWTFNTRLNETYNTITMTFQCSYENNLDSTLVMINIRKIANVMSVLLLSIHTCRYPTTILRETYWNLLKWLTAPQIPRFISAGKRITGYPKHKMLFFQYYFFLFIYPLVYLYFP